MLTIALHDGDETGIGGWRMDIVRQDLSSFAHVLSVSERARCDAMTVIDAADLRRAAHILKRQVVGARIGLKPDAVPFAEDDGAPRLLRPHHETSVSLSHTRGAVAVAVANDPVGIDVEPIDRTDDVVRLAARYFTAAEAQVINASDDPRFEFAWRWTAKEALLKACGLSLSQALAMCVGSLSRGRNNMPFSLSMHDMHITVFSPAPDYVCAVARR